MMASLRVKLYGRFGWFDTDWNPVTVVQIWVLQVIHSIFNQSQQNLPDNLMKVLLFSKLLCLGYCSRTHRPDINYQITTKYRQWLPYVGSSPAWQRNWTKTGSKDRFGAAATVPCGSCCLVQPTVSGIPVVFISPSLVIQTSPSLRWGGEGGGALKGYGC